MQLVHLYQIYETFQVNSLKLAIYKNVLDSFHQFNINWDSYTLPYLAKQLQNRYRSFEVLYIKSMTHTVTDFVQHYVFPWYEHTPMYRENNIIFINHVIAFVFKTVTHAGEEENSFLIKHSFN